MARPADAHALAEMNRIFNASEVTPRAIQENLRTSTELVAVALCNGRRAGYACAHVHDSFCYHAPYAEITELFVRAEYRRYGIATKLICFMERRLATKGVIHLHILTGVRNGPARTLYEKLGYRRATTEVLYEKSMHSSAVAGKDGLGKRKSAVRG